VFGPYLADTDTDWGAVVNLDGPDSAEVRRYIADNVRFWFTDMHVDALRLDAVHALVDSSEIHLLEELAVVTAEASAHLRRPLTLIAESDQNDPRLVTPRQGGGIGVDAQWSDDFHHALHSVLTGEVDGYYADFGSLATLAATCERGFYRDGSFTLADGSTRGHPTDVATLPGWRLVVCYSNHDQIGNRAAGDRPGHLLDDDQLASAALLTLTTAYTPMLFQGEEWAASAPFPFFSSHPEPELSDAVTTGRLAEFDRMNWDLDTVLRPQDPDTFARARLDWAEPEVGRHATILQVHRQLIALRRELSELTDPAMTGTSCSFDEDARWFLMRRNGLAVVVNFGDAEASVNLGGRHSLRWATPSGARLAGTSVVLPPHAGALLLPLA
jgi:malto-oligosyltrehalose trehalohydrolase